MTATEEVEMGAKPSKQTPKDGRLKRNMPKQPAMKRPATMPKKGKKP